MSIPLPLGGPHRAVDQVWCSDVQPPLRGGMLYNQSLWQRLLYLVVIMGLGTPRRSGLRPCRNPGAIFIRRLSKRSRRYGRHHEIFNTDQSLGPRESVGQPFQPATASHGTLKRPTLSHQHGRQEPALAKAVVRA